VLERDVVCEVAVVGGGITGALAAYCLAEAGIEVVLLDKRSVAHGSTSASTALLLPELDTHLGRLIEIVGEKHAVRSYRPVRVLSRLFRRRFLEALHEAFDAGTLHFGSSLEALRDRTAFLQHLAPLDARNGSCTRSRPSRDPSRSWTTSAAIPSASPSPTTGCSIWKMDR